MKQHNRIVRSAKILNVISAGLMFVTGLLLLVIPNLGTTTAQRILLGVLFGLTGGAKIFGYFSNDLYRLAFQFDFAIGVYCELLTLLIALLPERVFDALPLLISVYVTLDALLKLQMSFDAKRFGMKSSGDFTVWDLNAVSKIEPRDFLSMGKSTPFTGWEISGKCMATVCGGKIVYKA